MYQDTDVSALNSADQSPTHPLPPHNQQQHQTNSHQNSFHHHQNQSDSHILVDEPPQNPILMRNNTRSNNSNQKPSSSSSQHQQQHHQRQASSPTDTIPAGAGSCGGETCPFCSVDAARLTSEIRTLQHQVSLLTSRLQYSEDKSKNDRDKIENCISQMDEYSTGLSVVMKWTKSISSALPKLIQGIVSSSPSNKQQKRSSSNNNRRVTTTTSTGVGGKPPIAASKNTGGGTISNDVSAILHEDEDDQQNHNEFSQLYENEDFSDDDDKEQDEDDEDNNNKIPVSEVRKMFRTFRDEIIRLRERNKMLEQRVNDAVCKFEGTNTHKLREEVEGRLRTMMHSLHETMNGSNSPLSELSQQVSSLRTEVELVRSKTEAAATHRTLLETRINDATSKLREVDSNIAKNNNSNSNYSQQTQRMLDQQNLAYGEEIREIRQAMKELSSTVNHRLENERSAREFDAGDIRSQLKVLLRSPSPMARIGGGSGNDGLITSTSPQR